MPPYPPDVEPQDYTLQSVEEAIRAAFTLLGEADEETPAEAVIDARADLITSRFVRTLPAEFSSALVAYEAEVAKRATWRRVALDGRRLPVRIACAALGRSVPQAPPASKPWG